MSTGSRVQQDGAQRLLRMRALFDLVVEMPPNARAEYLAREAGPDVALREEVEALITSLDETDARFSGSADVLRMQSGRRGSLAGQRLGPYEVVALVGRGGMGEVYEAVRADDQFRKRVAIKIVNAGIESELSLARFRRERQILATLEHPHIATLLDGGVTPDGLPFLVMEFVEGEPITSWCEARTLSVRERVTLFRQVCDAVRHAHANLVIHRDLKPANILVTGSGSVKLLDFGIAKLLGEDDVDVTMPITRGSARAFTPEYASPEQIRGHALGTSTDVYSLGVVLFELLAGRRPHVSEERGPLGVEGLVLSEPAPRPSVVATDAAATTRRSSSVDALRRQLRGELDQVVLKALRADTERRYASAEALDDDLRRYLERLPVSAQGDSAPYRLRKFVMRNRTVVAAAALTLVAMAGGTGVAQWQARAARREATRAARVAEFLERILASGATSITSGSHFGQANLTMREVLDTAAQRLPTELATEPLVRARLHRVLGGGYHAGGNPARAREQVDSAIAIHTRELGTENLEVADDLASKALILQYTRPDSALPFAREALDIYRRLRAPDTLFRHQVALMILAEMQMGMGDQRAADSTLRRIITAERSRAHPRQQTLGVATGQLGYNMWIQGAHETAERTMREGIALLDSSDAGPSFEEAVHLYQLGTYLIARSRYADAIPVLTRSRDMTDAVVSAGHPLHLTSRIALADALSAAGDTAGAMREARVALAGVPSLAKGLETYAFLVQYRFAAMLRREHRLAEAEAAARLQLSTAMSSASVPVYSRADAHWLLGGVLSDRGKFAEAEEHLLAAYRDAGDPGQSRIRATRGALELAKMYLRQHRTREATPLLTSVTASSADSIRRLVSSEGIRGAPTRR